MLINGNKGDVSIKAASIVEGGRTVQSDGTGLIGHQHNVIDGMLIAALASVLLWVLALMFIF